MFKAVVVTIAEVAATIGVAAVIIAVVATMVRQYACRRCVFYAPIFFSTTRCAVHSCLANPLTPAPCPSLVHLQEECVAAVIGAWVAVTGAWVEAMVSRQQRTCKTNDLFRHAKYALTLTLLSTQAVVVVVVAVAACVVAVSI